MTHHDGRIVMREIEALFQLPGRQAEDTLRAVEITAVDVGVAMVDDRAAPAQFGGKLHHRFRVRPGVNPRREGGRRP